MTHIHLPCPSRRPFAAAATCLALLLGAAQLMACTSQRIYALPPRVASQADYAADPLVACATVRNYQAERDGNVVKIYFDDKTSTQYDLSRAAGQTMAILIDDNAMTPVEANKVFAETKQKSEELFACATAPGSGVVDDGQTNANDASAAAADPSGGMLLASSMGDVAPSGDSCAILASCYADIAATVCNATDADCRANYTVSPEISDDAEKCQQTLGNIPTMASSLQSERPGFKVPSSCSTPQVQQAPSAASGKLNVDASSGTAQGAAAADSYNGTWQAKVTYSYSCDGGKKGKANDGNQVGTYTMTIAGEPEALKAQVKNAAAGFALQGQADEAGLRLCGALPLRAQAGGPSPAKDTNVCFVVEKGDTAGVLKGHAEGTFQSKRGACTINEATVQLQR